MSKYLLQVPIAAYWRARSAGTALLSDKIRKRHSSLEFHCEMNSSDSGAECWESCWRGLALGP